MKRRSKKNKLSSAENKKPRWWVQYIVAPIVVGLIVGLTIWMVQESTDPKHGELRISCEIDSVNVYLNEQPRGLITKGKVMEVVSLEPGNYFLSIIKDGFANYTQNVKIVTGEITFIKAKLLHDKAGKMPVGTSKPVTGKRQTETPLHPLTITVQSQFKNAKILIDDEWRANAPNTVFLSQGQYLLRIEKNDYFYEEMIDVPGRSLINILDSEFQKVQAAKH